MQGSINYQWLVWLRKTQSTGITGSERRIERNASRGHTAANYSLLIHLLFVVESRRTFACRWRSRFIRASLGVWWCVASHSGHGSDWSVPTDGANTKPPASCDQIHPFSSKRCRMVSQPRDCTAITRVAIDGRVVKSTISQTNVNLSRFAPVSSRTGPVSGNVPFITQKENPSFIREAQESDG